MDITFTNTTGQELEKPQPASKHLPEWYVKMDSYMEKVKKPNGNGAGEATVKRCMPVFDAITAGYIITLPGDVYVSIREGTPTDPKTGEVIKDLPIKRTQFFEWANFGPISFHPIEQAPNHPARNEHQFPKWTNPWAIKTPKGYSTLFMQPMHRESVFTILPGIVDTDDYCAPVHFPFVINDPNFEGLIPKDTLIAQVIPFKRDSWESFLGGPEDFTEQNNVNNKLQTKFFDRYKTMFRTQKEYK